MQSYIPTYSKHRKKEPLVALLPPGGGGEVREVGGGLMYVSAMPTARFSERIVSDWNSFPHSVVSANKANSFKVD